MDRVRGLKYKGVYVLDCGVMFFSFEVLKLKLHDGTVLDCGFNFRISQGLKCKTTTTYR